MPVGGHEKRKETEKTMERAVMAAQGEMGRREEKGKAVRDK